MSPLTKAFVVLVTLLSILLVALVVPFVAKTDDLQGDITDLKGQLVAANAVASSKTAEVASLQQGASADNARLQDRITALLGDNTKLTQSVTTLEAQVKEANSKVDKLGASLVLAQNSINQITSLLEGRTTALTTAQTDNVDLKQVNAELTQRNGELDAQVTGLDRRVRLLQEQLADAQSGGSGASASAQPSASGPGKEVLGSVTGVQPVVDGITLISANLGSNDQVSPRTQFVIFRNGSDYVGTATVMSVDANASVLRVDNAQSKVQPGDTLMAGIRY